MRRGTRLKLGGPAGGVQAGWQTSSGRLAVAGSGWFGCETADVAAERRGEARSSLQPALPAGAWAPATRGSAHAETRYADYWWRHQCGQRVSARSKLRVAVCRVGTAGSWAQKRRGRNGEGDHSSRNEQPHCHVPVRTGTGLRLGRPAGGVQAGWQTSSGWPVAADSGWFSCETADVAAKQWVRPTGSCEWLRCQHELGLC